MKRVIVFLLIALAFISCISGRKQSTKVTSVQIVQPRNYTFKIKNSYPHLQDSYTQGLEFRDGVLWEGTGQNGESRLMRVDLLSGKTKVVANLPKSDFGEGITILNDEIFQLTWTSNKAYVYDLNSGKLKREHRYLGEGWGLTNDGEMLYMSDGGSDIYVVDPSTFKRVRSFTVTLKGEPVEFLNELEWIEGRIWANIYTSDYIVIIDPKSGVVEGVIDLEGLLAESEIGPKTDVLNGIAYCNSEKRIFVTGKNWPKLFEIEIIER